MMNMTQKPMPDMMCGRDDMSESMNRKELNDWLSMLNFCSIDMLLYLDTHPDDREALEYFNQCTELYQSAKRTYERRFGQINAFSGGPLECWDWNAAPMPWEGGR